MKRSIRREIELTSDEVAEAILAWLRAKDIQLGDNPHVTFSAADDAFFGAVVSSTSEDSPNGR